MIDYNVTEQVNPRINYVNRCRYYLLPSVMLLKSWQQIYAVSKMINAVTTKESRRTMSFY